MSIAVQPGRAPAAPFGFSRPRRPGPPGRPSQPTGYVPPGWPSAVRPPGAPDWEATASAFLLDCCPPDVRLYGVLRRHPIVLAIFAAKSVDAQVRACTAGLAECRASLAEYVPAGAIESATEAWKDQLAALQRMCREVSLVERALRGAVFVEKL